MPEPGGNGEGGPSLLDLDFVSHVSVVDEPAVPQAEVLVAKRAGSDDPPDGPVVKAGRELSQENFEALAGILQSAEGGSLGRVRQSLRDFLAERSTEAQIEQVEMDLESSKVETQKDAEGSDLTTIIEKNMDNSEEFISELSSAVKDATQEGVEEALQEAEITDNPEGTEEPDQPGSSEPGEQEAILEEIRELEDRIDGAFSDEGADSGSGSQTTEQEEPDPTEVEVDEDADLQEQVEQAGKKVETALKALEQDGRAGTRTSKGSAGAGSDDDGGISFAKSVREQRQTDNSDTQEV